MLKLHVMTGTARVLMARIQLVSLSLDVNTRAINVGAGFHVRHLCLGINLYVPSCSRYWMVVCSPRLILLL